jgi:tetratricopeptide (TPR) repeat protein
MIVTFVILGVAVLGIGSYTVYAKVLMPTPVAMGAVTSLPELPQPIYSDNQVNKGRAQSSSPTEQPAQAKSTEQETQNTAQPPAAEQAPLPIETSAVAQEQEPAETEQPPAMESQAETTEGKNSPAAAAGPTLGDTKSAKPIEDTKTAKKDKMLAQAPATRSASKAVSPPVQTAAERVEQNVKRKRATVRAASSAKPPSDYKAIVKRANALYRSRKTRGQAVAEYQRALTLNPNGGEALRKLSYYYLNQGRSSDAEQFAVRAVRANQSNAQSWFLLGAAREARNNHQGAQQAYRGCAQGKGAYATQCKALLQ